MPNKLFRAWATLTVVIARLQQRLERVFLSKRENDRRLRARASRRASKLQRTTTEAERLDRLRNPHRYQGR